MGFSTHVRPKSAADSHVAQSLDMLQRSCSVSTLVGSSAMVDGVDGLFKHLH